jgi:hypothetical protein
MPDLKLSPDAYCPAFLTTMQIGGPRVPISAERIVVVLGEDDKTGLPLELSICLRRSPSGSISICAFREPLPDSPWRDERSFPSLIVEKGPVGNERFVSVSYAKHPKPERKTPA